MRVRSLALAMVAVAGAAHAGDKPLVTPTPAWVKLVDPPIATTAKGDAPLTVLLSDQQVRFERGKVITYQHVLLRIDNAQGLAVGNISLPWRPDVGDLAVHRLAIHRGSQVIDVLASGQTFTVIRRETNLDSAMFDGMLTANIQPEGLQVGDVLELASSTSVADPVLAGHADQALALGGPLPIGRVHLAASWPVGTAVRVHAVGVAIPKPARQGDREATELIADGVQPVVPPKLAPARYQLGRFVEMSDYASWADLAALLAPLYAKAAVVPGSGPLADEVAKIRAASPDPAARTMAALALVQNRVRYVALAMGAGGMVPADAATTWSRRFGDCKAKTVLLIGILHALDIAAEPVAVRSSGGDGLDDRIPSAGAFDHVLVRATVAGRTLWLDGTRIGDTAIDRLEVPNVGWGLPLVARGAALVRMVPPPLSAPAQETEVAIDATQGLTVPAPVTVTQRWRGDGAIALNTGMANLVGETRERTLRDWWKRQYDFIDPDKVDAGYDTATGEFTMSLRGKARMDWSTGWYETDGLSMGWKADLTRPAGSDREAPYAVDYPAYTRTVETIRLPLGFPDKVPLDKVAIDRTVGGIEYRRRGAIEGRVFRVEATQRSIAPEFPARDAAATEAALREMAAMTLYIRRPANYQMSDAEIAAGLASPPATVDGQLVLGYALENKARWAEALKVYDAVLKLEPANRNGLANRALARSHTGDVAGAKRDVDAVLAADPRQTVALHAAAFIAEQAGDATAAYGYYKTAIGYDPADRYALYRRAIVSHAISKPEVALADVDAVIAVAPEDPSLRLLRFNVLHGAGRDDEAVAGMHAATAANDGNAYLHVAAANAYAALGRPADMAREYDRALAIKPEAYIYVNRAMRRPAADVSARLADLDAALKLDPKSADALGAKADLQRRQGNPTGAIATYDAALAIDPANVDLLTGRGIAETQAGRREAGERDFVAARGKATAVGPAALNNLCWTKATAGAALDSALADCDAALAKAPDMAAALDSRAFVLLRMGRLPDAIAGYDKALAIAPKMAASLYGRSIAYRRAGDKTRADADVAAARTLDATIADRFADYGVSAP